MIDDAVELDSPPLTGGLADALRPGWLELRARATEWCRCWLGPTSPDRVARLAMLYACQNRMIFPGRRTHGQPVAEFDAPRDAERLTLWTGPRGRVRGRKRRVAALFGRALGPDGRTLRPEESCRRPTVLFLYGNDMYLAATQHIFHRIRALGANALVPEYEGYGLSEGSPSEAGCYRTADAAWRHLQQRTDIDRSRIVAAGVSLGGAVAVDLAARTPLAGLITLVTFTSMPDMARHLFPDVPIWRHIRHPFHSERKIARVTCPMLIGHSTGDRLVPYEMADRLADAAAGPVRRLKIDGAGHKATEMLEVGGDRIFAAVGEFLRDVERC